MAGDIHRLWMQTSDPEIAELMETRTTKTAYPRQMVQYCNEGYLSWLVTEITERSYLLHDFGKQFGLFNYDPKLLLSEISTDNNEPTSASMRSTSPSWRTILCSGRQPSILVPSSIRN